MGFTKLRWQENQALEFRARLWRCVALFLLFSMATHTLDACAAHFGLPDNLPSPSPQATLAAVECPQSDALTFVFSCSNLEHQHIDLCEDLCETTSEYAHRLDDASALKASLIALSTWAALPSAVYQLAPPRQTPQNHHDLKTPVLPTLAIGSVLPNRAPPHSA